MLGDQELLIRGSAIGVFIALAVVLCRPPLLPSRVTGVLLSLSAAAHTLTQMTGWEQVLGLAWPVAWVLSVAGAGLFWAFATELFADRTQTSLVRFAPAAILLAIGVAASSAPVEVTSALWITHNVIGGLLMAHVLVAVSSGWRNDLIEGRRRLRGPVLVAAALYGVGVVTVQTAEILLSPADWLTPVGAVFLLVIGLAAAAVFLRTEPTLFARLGDGRSSDIDEALSPSEVLLAERLDKLMSVDRVYRDPGLSVGALAARLGIVERELRRLINRKLGHRNFAAFLNERRLAETKDALIDPSQRAVPISTIALDAGFGSMGPFNRAFKQANGVTPTEYRARGTT